MKKWSSIDTKEKLESRYRSLIPEIRVIAQRAGYAIGLHGSLRRDLDLIAVPWIKKPLKPSTLALRIQEAVSPEYMWNTRKQFKAESRRARKPQGRHSYIIHLGTLGDSFCRAGKGHAYIDLSVMPMR